MRPSRPRSRRRGHSADARPAGAPGPPGRRQYAGLRQEPVPCRGERAGGVHGDAAPGRRISGSHSGCSEAICGSVIMSDPMVLAPVLAAALLYVRGFTPLARRMPRRFGASRLVAFIAGLAVLLLAASPRLDELSHSLLQAHMTQHLMPMMLAPPLLCVAAPVVPMLLGLPRPLRLLVARALGSPAVRSLARVLTHSALGWMAFVIAFWSWHIPALFDLALRSDLWHHV